ncbi:MAG: PilZ domain-containing protein, partial [Polyangiales bacterium]
EIRGVMCDLSQGGMGLETDQPIEEGETITVRVALGGFPHPLQLEGEVVHVRATEDGKYQAGLRFQQLDPERTGGLRDLLQFMVKEG